MLAKDLEVNGPRLARVMYNLLESIRISAVLLTPFMPQTCEKIFAQIGADASLQTWESAGTWGRLPADAQVSRGDNLFPRIDVKKELEELEKASEAAKQAAQDAKEPEYITIDDFAKVKFLTCKVLECDAVKKSKKLLRFTLDCGEGQTRQILSGQDPGGLRQSGPPKDDGPGVQRDAHFRREGDRRQGAAPPADAGRQGARRL